MPGVERWASGWNYRIRISGFLQGSSAPYDFLRSKRRTRRQRIQPPSTRIDGRHETARMAMGLVPMFGMDGDRCGAPGGCWERLALRGEAARRGCRRTYYSRADAAAVIR